MAGKGELTDLLQTKPVNIQKTIRYALTKNICANDLFALSFACFDIKKALRREISLLTLATCKFNHKVIEILLQEGWSVNGIVNEAEPPLWSALAVGNIPAAKLLIQKGADINVISSHGNTLMDAALAIDESKIVEKNETDCIQGVKLLIDAGFSVNDWTFKKNRERAIHQAACNKHNYVLNFLIRNGANVNAKESEGFTALHISSLNNDVTCIKTLMNYNGIDLYVQNNFGDTALESAVKNDSKEAVMTLVKGGFNVNQSSDEYSSSALIVAVGMLKLEMVRILLDLGADPNLQVNLFTSPLLVVASRNTAEDWSRDKKSMLLHKHIAQLLIERGANINTDHYCNPLTRAICQGFYGLAKLFVRLGANVNIRHHTHYTLFHLVVSLNCDIIELFLEYGGDYNSLNETKETPFNLAISRNIDLKFIKCFIKFGCPYDQNLNMLKTQRKKINSEIHCLFAAGKKFFQGIKENDLNLVTAAINEGAVVNGCSEEIKFPIHFLAFHGYNKILDFLLERGVPPNILNKDGDSALSIAAKLGNYDCCFTLLKYGACYDYSFKPKDIQSKQVRKLVQNVRKMFAFTCLGNKKVISELENLMMKDINKYLIYVNAINCRGDTLLTTALRKNHRYIAQELIKLRTRHSL